jgi:hypothetical protein
MFANAKPSEIVALLGEIAPVSQGAGAVTTAWVSMAQVGEILAIIQTGVLGTSATVDAKIQQATDSSGTSAKDITGKAITQIVKASGDGKQALINVRSSDLDVSNGFGYVQLSITVGTAASEVAGTVLGFNPRFMDASALNAATVVQVV